jgi:hypothetical protein
MGCLVESAVVNVKVVKVIVNLIRGFELICTATIVEVFGLYRAVFED